MQNLTPCPSCQRHVLLTESSCPFCQAELSAHMAQIAPRANPVGQLGRAALFAFGASVAVAAAGCGGDDGDNKGTPHDAAAADASEPTRDATVADASAHDAGDQDSGRGNVMPLYGAPPQPVRDAEVPPADAATDAATNSDAGPPDHGGVVALYAAPPRPTST